MLYNALLWSCRVHVFTTVCDSVPSGRIGQVEPICIALEATRCAALCPMPLHCLLPRYILLDAVFQLSSDRVRASRLQVALYSEYTPTLKHQILTASLLCTLWFVSFKALQQANLGLYRYWPSAHAITPGRVNNLARFISFIVSFFTVCSLRELAAHKAL